MTAVKIPHPLMSIDKNGDLCSLLQLRSTSLGLLHIYYWVVVRNNGGQMVLHMETTKRLFKYLHHHCPPSLKTCHQMTPIKIPTQTKNAIKMFIIYVIVPVHYLCIYLCILFMYTLFMYFTLSAGSINSLFM